MKHLDLCSGIGGFAVAAKWAKFETVGFCEIDQFCQGELNRNFPGVPVHNDIRSLQGDEFGPIDIITGGYPCQPFSLSGKRRGRKDVRHLWPELLRVIKRTKPSWIVCENVYGHVTLGLDEVCDDMEKEGYAVRPFIVPASSKDAPHNRKRVWIVANLPNSASSNVEGRTKEPLPEIENIQVEFRRMGEVVGICTDEGESTIPGAIDGVSAELDPDRKERLIALGNAVVPQVAYEIFRAIINSN